MALIDEDLAITPLLQQAERVADITSQRNIHNMLQALNKVYADAPEHDEDALREGMRQQHKQLVEGQW